MPGLQLFSVIVGFVIGAVFVAALGRFEMFRGKGKKK